MGRGSLITDLSTVHAGDVLWVECRDAVTGALLQPPVLIVWDPGQPSVVVPPSAEQLAQQASAELVLPESAVRTWPPAGHALVGLETWFHIDSFEGEGRTASVGPVSASVRAEPVRAVWHLGETDLTCTTAGTVWAVGREETDCGYTFGRYTGAEIPASVDVVYHLTWSSNVGDVGDLGEVTRTTAFGLRVWEAQAVIE